MGGARRCRGGEGRGGGGDNARGVREGGTEA